MILSERDCDNCDDGSEPGRGFMTVRLCSKCHGIQKVRECLTCLAAGITYHKFGLYSKRRCYKCNGTGWTPAWDGT